MKNIKRGFMGFLSIVMGISILSISVLAEGMYFERRAIYQTSQTNCLATDEKNNETLGLTTEESVNENSSEMTEGQQDELDEETSSAELIDEESLIVLEENSDYNTVITGITLSQTSASLVQGQTLQLIATISPNDAADQIITWSSNNNSVAKVSDGMVTAVGVGTATITAAADNNISAACMVTVTAPVSEVTGNLNADILWLYNPNTKQLWIEGQGKMIEDPNVPEFLSFTDESCKEILENAQKVYIGDGITSVMADCFNDFRSLESVYIGKDVNALGANAFQCNSLLDITVDAGNQSFCVRDKGLYNYKMTKLYRCFVHDEGLVFRIPDGVTTIAQGAFYSCELSKVVLPESLTKMGRNTFEYASVNSIVIPDAIVELNGTFARMKSIQRVYIGRNVAKVNRPFELCSGLEKVYFAGDMPSGMTFSDFSTGTKVIYPKNNTTWDVGDSGAAILKPWNFYLLPISSIAVRPSGTAVLKWASRSHATGYQIQYADNRDFTNKTTVITNDVNTLSQTISGLEKNKTIDIRIRAYKKVNDTHLYTNWYTVSCDCTWALYKPSITSLSSQSPTSIEVKWTARSGAAGYQIQYATDSKYTDFKTVTITDKSTTASTIGGLTKGQTYYVRIRAGQKINSTTVYSVWSSSKKISLSNEDGFVNGIKETYLGVSGSGRAMYSYQIGTGRNHIVITAEVHGWEDSFKADGICLSETAEALIKYASKNLDVLDKEDYAIYIIPRSNPDGLIDGTTNYGPGRCTTYRFNASGKLVKGGVDINRSFPYGFTAQYNARNYTGPNSLMSRESRIIKKFIDSNKGSGRNVYIDMHGWENSILTDRAGSGIGYTAFHKYFSGARAKAHGAKGYVSGYAYSKNYVSILFEFPYVSSKNAFANADYGSKFIKAIWYIVQNYQ